MTRTATRHRCGNAGVYASCTRGNGKPRAAKCRYCGARLIVEQGVYGVFVWRGDGRYPLADAVKTFTSPTAADRFADAHAAENYVTRWILAA